MVFLVTGASGAGKSTVRRLLEPRFTGRVESCELVDLGITPEWTLKWRHQAVEQMVQRALHFQRIGRHFLLCGDPIPPGELYAVPSAGAVERIEVCLLDVAKPIQEQRLRARGDAVELLPHHVAFAEWMRQHVRDHRHRPEVIIRNGWEKMRWEVWTAPNQINVPWRCHIVDTSELNPFAVAERVGAWMATHLQSVSG